MTILNTPKAALSRLPRLLSVAEVAAHLGVCTKTVRRLIQSGALPTTRAGQQFRVTEQDLATYMAWGKAYCPVEFARVQAFQQVQHVSRSV
jgi:excisionase family DNA binding protein